jgi:hypothetical protein
MKTEVEMMEIYNQMKAEANALFFVKDNYGPLSASGDVALNERVIKLQLLQDILGTVG